MDKLGLELIKLELAIPGIFAAFLKLGYAESEILASHPALYLSLAFWMLALIITVISLIPRKWKVDPHIIKQDPNSETDVFGIEDYFSQSAKYKRRLHIIASVLFLLGNYCAILSVITRG